MKRIVTALSVLAVATAAYAADGKASYDAKCKACHGAAGEGTKMAPNAIAGMSADAVKKAVTEGKGKMKPVKVDDVDGVSAYVSGLKK